MDIVALVVACFALAVAFAALLKGRADAAFHIWWLESMEQRKADKVDPVDAMGMLTPKKAKSSRTMWDR